MGEHPQLGSGSPVNNGAQQGTTTFSTITKAQPYDRHSSLIDPQNDYDVETDDIKSIADFLAKPVSVASGTFSAANTWGASLFSSSILTLLNAQPLWLNKIQGFLNIRGNVKFRLVINPTPFQQGLLRMQYFPCANMMASSYNSHMFNRMTISQLPGTYLNMNDNFCEITVPYLSPTTFLERDLIVASNHVDWGNIDINVFEIFRTGTGPSSVNWTLWMSIEDLELSGMVEPQMCFYEPQMARKRISRALPIDGETNSGKGPIAKIMSSGAILASNLATIPSLTPLAKPASWVFSALSSAAEALGWSKPTFSDGPSPIHRNLHSYMNNSDGNDSCAPLSLRTDNRISAITDASPGELDEMSVNFLKTRWCYLYDFQWATASAAGTLLSSYNVSPSNMKQSQVVNARTVATTPPCAVFQEFYGNWRGSFQVRVRLIKTGFHTGTLAFTWCPGRNTGVPSYTDTAYMYRQIIDIQSGSEFVIDLPYLIAQDFLSVSDSSGVFMIHVVNPLLAPATCSSTLDVFVEIRGGDDLIYVAPKNLYDPVPYVPQMVEYEAQGVDTEVSGEGVPLAMSSRMHNLDSLHHAMIANGEIQLSVLDILKAQSVVRYATGISPSNLAGAPCLIPAGQIYAQRWNGILNVSSPIGGDLVSFIGSWFAFNRGSERFRFCPRDAANANVNFRAMLVTDNDTGASQAIFNQTAGNGTDWSALLSATDGGTAPKTGRYLTVPRDNGGLAVQVPFYSRYRYLLNYWATELTSTVSNYSQKGSAAIALGSAIGITTSRSVGDDFQYSFFLGIPVYASASTNAGPFVNIS